MKKNIPFQAILIAIVQWVFNSPMIAQSEWLSPLQWKSLVQDPQKNLITRALGVSANIVPEYNRCEVVPGDLLLLCTDGLTNMVPDAELALLLQESAFFDAPGVLVDRALKGGGQDNITVLLLGVETTEETNG